MKNVTMKAYKVKEISFKDNIKASMKLNLSNKVSHNVKYNKNGLCEATLSVETFDKQNPDILNVKVLISGIFAVKPGVEKEFVHVDTFNELFPLAKSLIITISANAGIQPIIIQNIDIENEKIYRFEMNPKENSPEAEK